jgi:hypothetical protein
LPETRKKQSKKRQNTSKIAENEAKPHHKNKAQKPKKINQNRPKNQPKTPTKTKEKKPFQTCSNAFLQRVYAFSPVNNFILFLSVFIVVLYANFKRIFMQKATYKKSKNAKPAPPKC